MENAGIVNFLQFFKGFLNFSLKNNQFDFVFDDF